MKYKVSQYAKKHGVTIRTVWNWINKGELDIVRNKTNHVFIIEDENKGVYHVCEIDGKVVGQIMYTYEWSDWRNGTFIWVQSVYVDKEHRGKGAFKALYNKIKEICDSSNEYVGIRLYVEKENYTAQKTYRSLGMEECNYFMYEYEK